MRISVWNHQFKSPTEVEKMALRILTLIALMTLGLTMWRVGVPWWGVGLHLLSMLIFMNIWFIEGLRRVPDPDYTFDSAEGLEALARVLKQSEEQRDEHT